MTQLHNKGRAKIRQALRGVFPKRSTTPPEHRRVAEDTALHPCPSCGACQWQFGLVDAQCAACGGAMPTMDRLAANSDK
jgi:hypothetical protein